MGDQSTSNGEFYEKVLSIFTDKFTKELHDRQAVAIEKICKQCRHGFPLKDLSYIARTLQYVHDVFSNVSNVADLQVFVQPLNKLITLCGCPMFREKSGDTLRYRDDMLEVVTNIGELLLWIPDIQCGAAEALKNFVDVTPSPPPPVAFYQQIITESGIISTFLEILLRNSPDTDEYLETPLSTPSSTPVPPSLTPAQDNLYTDILRAFVAFADYKANLIQLYSGSVMRVIASILVAKTHSGLALELLWKVLEGIPEARTGPYIGPIIYSLSSIVEEAMQCSIANKRLKELRDDAIAIAGLLAFPQENENHFYGSGFLDHLLEYCTVHEFGKSKDTLTIMDQFATSSSQEDFELRKLMLNIIFHTATHQNALVSLEKFYFVKMLLMYIEIPPSNPAVQKWPPSHLKDLQAHALLMLSRFVPLLPEMYSKCHGNKMLVKFLTLHMGPPSASIPSPDNSLVHAALHVLVNMADLFKKNLGQEGLTKTLINHLSDTSQPLQTRHFAILTLTILCDENKLNQLEFGERGGVAAILPYLKYSPSEPVRKEDLVVAALDCVWVTIVGHPANEPRFIENGGVEKLLDLLECCPSLMQFQVLGCLSDLMENRKTYQIVREWYSSTSYRAASQLLIALWCKEEARLEVHTEQGGAIADIARPLVTKRDLEAKNEWRMQRMHARAARQMREQQMDIQYEQENPTSSQEQSRTSTAATQPRYLQTPATHTAVRSLFNPNASLAVSEVPTPRQMRRAAQHVITTSDNVLNVVSSLDLRDKIFSIFNKIGFSVQDQLTPQEQLKLTLIERYMDLRLGEVWEDMAEELEYEQVRPVSPDAEMIRGSIMQAQNLASILQKSQRSLVEQTVHQELMEEQKLYDSITHHRNMKEKMKLDSLTKGRMSRYQKDAIKALQERKEMIKNSRIFMSTLDEMEVYELDFRADKKAINALAQQQEEDDEDQYIDF